MRHEVLVVDDSLTVRMDLKDALETAGYRVALAAGLAAARQAISTAAPDLLVLGAILPESDGLELFRELRASPDTASLPVMVLSSDVELERAVRGFAGGAREYASKPHDMTELVSLANRMLEGRQSELDAIVASAKQPRPQRGLAVCAGRNFRSVLVQRKRLERENRRLREGLLLLRKEMAAREARAARDLAEERGRLLSKLELVNSELGAFSYSVSHDLRSPLRAIEGLAKILQEDYRVQLEPEGLHLVDKILGSSLRLEALMEALLRLSQLTNAPLTRERVDVAALSRELFGQLAGKAPDRKVDFVVAPRIEADGDPDLIRAMLVNLLDNAWKYTAKHDRARIEVGCELHEEGPHYFVRDDGAGFEPQYAGRLFGTFQRLHPASQFDGLGIGLATVQRIVHRHGGRVWARAEPEKGATFWFTLK